MQWWRNMALVAFLVWIGLPSTASAYAIRTTTAGQPVHWTGSRVELRVDGSCIRVAAQAEVRRAVLMATEAWRGLPGVPDLDVVDGDPGPVGTPADMAPSNGIYAVEHWPYDPERLAVTVTTYDAESGAMIDADILINSAQLFAVLDEHHDDRLDRYDLASVLTHEMGHVLGLEESDVRWATMWPIIGRGETFQRTLELDDEEGAIALYEHAAVGHTDVVAGCGGANLAGGTGDRSAPPLAAVGVAWLILVLRRRRASSRS